MKNDQIRKMADQYALDTATSLFGPGTSFSPGLSVFGEARLSSDEIWIILTDEERQIARHNKEKVQLFSMPVTKETTIQKNGVSFKATFSFVWGIATGEFELSGPVMLHLTVGGTPMAQAIFERTSASPADFKMNLTDQVVSDVVVSDSFDIAKVI